MSLPFWFQFLTFSILHMYTIHTLASQLHHNRFPRRLQFNTACYTHIPSPIHHSFDHIIHLTSPIPPFDYACSPTLIFTPVAPSSVTPPFTQIQNLYFSSANTHLLLDLSVHLHFQPPSLYLQELRPQTPPLHLASLATTRPAIPQNPAAKLTPHPQSTPSDPSHLFAAARPNHHLRVVVSKCGVIESLLGLLCFSEFQVESWVQDLLQKLRVNSVCILSLQTGPLDSIVFISRQCA